MTEDAEERFDGDTATGGHPVQYAGFFQRAAALAVDLAVIGAIMALALLPAQYILYLLSGRLSPGMRQDIRGFLFRFSFLLIHWLYYSLAECSLHQATPGKRLLGIRVTDLKGGRLSFWRATARTLAKFLSDLTLWIGFLIAAFTPRKQALHDYIAGCLVVRVQHERQHEEG